MRIIIPMFVFATACAEAPAATVGNEDTVPTMESDIVHTKIIYPNRYVENAYLNRYVDRQYNVVCYTRSRETLKCFPISDEGTVQYSLDFQNQTD